MRSSFRGDQKRTDSLLSTYDRQFANWAARRMPAWVQSHHLTLMTLGWSALVLVTARLAQHNTAWLWASSAVIGAQYFTDAIDGKLGLALGGRTALVFAIPLLLVGSLTVLVVMTYHIQKRLWTLDSATRRESTREVKASAHSQPNKRMEPAGPTTGAIRSPGPAAHS